MVLNRVKLKLVIDTSACDSGTPEFTDVMMDCLFNDPAGFWEILDL